MQRWKGHILILSAVSLGLMTASAADDIFYKRLMEANKSSHGFISEADLIQTNNTGPSLTNAAIPYPAFSGRGELAGVKLGMTMTEVVAAWGKPSGIYTSDRSGPEF